jgi:glycosyltransferase involved in cell wall biosynthesis
MKRRIAYITPTLGCGGAEQHVSLLCSHIDRNHYEPVVFCLKRSGAFAKAICQRDVPVVLLAGHKVISAKQRVQEWINSSKMLGEEDSKSRHVLYRLVAIVGTGLAETVSFLHLLLQLRLWRIDLVSAHWSQGVIGLLAAYLVGIPAVYTEHSVVHTYYTPSQVRFLRKLVPLARRVITVSQSARRSIIKHLGVPAKKIDVIGHAVQFDVPADENTPVRTDAPPTVAVLGSLGVRKGHAFFLQAAHELAREYPNVKFLIAGDGPLRSVLEEQVRNLGLASQVCFVGAYDNDAVPDILRDVSAVAVPSVTEAFGIVALEAMACGKPVVASAVGGLTEIVRNGETGLLVPPKDPEALANAIAHLFDNPDLRRRLGRAGRELACQQTPEQITAQTMSVYEKVLRSEVEGAP